jgi:hypothetical protein
MQLKSNFVSDWISILRDILENHWGYDTAGVADEHLPYVYFNAEKRRPDQRPRKIILSNTFKCPANLQTGWDRLQGLIETGQDITPNLSKLVKQLHNKDSMLNDWGVHHFHLGNNIKGEFTERTGPLMFSLITKENFYVIGVYEHGAWADAEIIEIIHRSWPDEVAQYQIQNIILATETTEQQRLTLRAKNTNSFVTVNDGTVYAPIGGGVVGAGYNIQAITSTDRQKSTLEALEKQLQSQLINIRDKLVEHGYSGESEVEAKLEITENEYIAILPKFGIAVTLMPNA